MDIPREEAMKRSVGRITCPACGSIYNEYFDTFTTKGYCNKCSTKMEKRVDDNEQTFNQRFNTYIEKTQPVIDYYKNKGLLHIVNSGINKEYTFNQIESILNGALK
jgi:adenylate kinase